MNDFMDRYTDEELIARFQQGDEYAFEEIVNRFKDRLKNFVYRYLSSEEAAEDVVQDTFLRVYQKKHMYRNIAKFSTWIYTIAGNLAKTELRKRKRRKMYSLGDLGLEDKEYEIPSEDFAPEEGVEGEFTEQEIQNAIDQLSEKFKTVIILRDIQELSYDEVSNIVDVPVGTVKSRINRARLKLQEKLRHLRSSESEKASKS